MRVLKSVPAFRLKEFEIGVTKVKPVSGIYSRLYDAPGFCAYVKGPLRPSETRNILCIGTGRFVIVVFLHTGQLVLCEVEVYSAPTGESFNVHRMLTY